MTEGSESVPPAPEGLEPAGTQLWRDIASLAPLDALQLVTLTEICRAKDRLDRLDAVLRGDADTWMWIQTRGPARGEQREVKIDAVLSQSIATANLLKQLLASLRLPDEVTGKRPQRRSGARNAPVGKTGNVSSLDRARDRSRG